MKNEKFKNVDSDIDYKVSEMNMEGRLTPNRYKTLTKFVKSGIITIKHLMELAKMDMRIDVVANTIVVVVYVAKVCKSLLIKLMKVCIK